MTALSKPNVKLARARAVAQQGFRDVEGKQLPFSARGVRLGEAGVAVPLLFETTWGMMIVMLIAFATNFAFGVVGDNWRARPRSPAWNMRCTLGPWEFFYPPLNNGTFFATGGAEDGMARARDQSELDNAACASLVVSVVLVLFMYWLDFQEQRVAKRVDKAFLTASDFAVEVRDLPLNACDAKEVSSFFGQFGEIAYVELAFASSEFSKLKQQWEKLAPEHAELKADGKQTAKLAAIAADLAALEEKMSSLKRAPRERGLGIAFVVFNEERARRKAIVAHKASVSRFLLRVLTCGCCGKVPKFRGKFMLTVLPAPEPMDVFWENLHVPRRRLRVRATIGVLGAVAVAMPLAFLLASAENRTEEISDAVVAKAHELHSEAGALAAKSEEEVIKQVVTQLKGLALKPITGVLTWSSTRLTQLEHRWTRTDYEQSLYFKAAIGILLNEALGAMIAGWNQPITADDWEGVLPSPNPPYPTFGWFESTDSVMASQYATIAASLLVVAYELLQPNMLVNRYVRARFAKSQARLDALWSPQQAGMGDYYLTLTTVVALGVICTLASSVPATATSCARYLANIARSLSTAPAIPPCSCRWPGHASCLPDLRTATLPPLLCEQIYAAPRLFEPAGAQRRPLHHLPAISRARDVHFAVRAAPAVRRLVRARPHEPARPTASRRRSICHECNAWRDRGQQ